MLYFNEDLKNFIDAVVPKDAPDIQVDEMRKAFISGAKIMHMRVGVLEVDEIMDYIEEVDDMFNLVCSEKDK